MLNKLQAPSSNYITQELSALCTLHCHSSEWEMSSILLSFSSKGNQSFCNLHWHVLKACKIFFWAIMYLKQISAMNIRPAKLLQGEYMHLAIYFWDFKKAGNSLRLPTKNIIPGRQKSKLVDSVFGLSGRPPNGHLALREALTKQTFDFIFDGSPVFAQFSSLGSLDAKWLHQEFQIGTLSAGRSTGEASSNFATRHTISHNQGTCSSCF